MMIRGYCESPWRGMFPRALRTQRCTYRNLNHSVFTILLLFFVSSATIYSGEASPSEDATKPKHDFSCGYVKTETFTRKLCFSPKIRYRRYSHNVHHGRSADSSEELQLEGGPSGDAARGPASASLALDLALDPNATAPAVYYTLLLLGLDLRVWKKGPAAGAAYEPACGDSLRIKFTSDGSVLSPHHVRERECGVHAVELLLPRDAAAYAAEVRLMHVDGRGLADPPHPLWEAYDHADLYAKDNQGPVVYNADAKIGGLLRGPADYSYSDLLRSIRDVRSSVPASWRYGRAAPDSPTNGSITGTDMGFVDSAEEGEVGMEQDGGVMDGCRAQWLGEAGHVTPQCLALNLRSDFALGLPFCQDGHAVGRWVRTRAMYPPFKDPWMWRPFFCTYKYYTSADLDKCLLRREQNGDIPPSDRRSKYVLFIGESTGNAIGNQFMEHVRSTEYYYADFVELHETDKLAHVLGYTGQPDSAPLRVDNQEVHGMEKLLRLLDGIIGGGRKMHTLVILEGANDAQKDTTEAFTARWAEFLQRLKKAQDDPDKGFDRNTTVVFVSPPARHYKPTGGNPGESVCQGATDSKGWQACEAVTVEDWKRPMRGPRGPLGGVLSRKPDGDGVVWIPRRGMEQVRFFDTVDRRRALASEAVRELRRVLPRARYVDYRALTEPLPPDYCFDGEHYHCPYHYVWERRAYPWQCKGMANAVVTNIVINAMCASG